MIALAVWLARTGTATGARTGAHGGVRQRPAVGRLRLRRLKFVREQFFLAAAAQDIRRLVRFLSHTQQPGMVVTT